MKSKVVIIVVALVLGGLAAVLAANYLNSARTDIAAESEPIAVLVAQQDLPRGLGIEELVNRKLVKVEQVPRRFVAADAVSSERVIESQVLAAPISAGEQLTKARFQYPSQAGLSYGVPENLVAVTVEVDDVTGVAGLLKPGDNVTVYSSFEPNGKPSAFTQMTVAKAKVLAIAGSTTAESGPANTNQKQSSGALASNRSSTDESAYKNVTLALSSEDAQRVAFSREFGTVQLALLGQNAADPKAPQPTSFTGTNLSNMRGITK